MRTFEVAMMVMLTVSLMATAISAATVNSEPHIVGIINCTGQQTWSVQTSPTAALVYTGQIPNGMGGWEDSAGKMCATFAEPPANEGIVFLQPCDGTYSQQIIFNASGWTDVNASGQLYLSPPVNASQIFGFTFSANPYPSSQGEKIAVFDIRRFHGTCEGHHNCGFNLKSDGTMTTYFPGYCLGIQTAVTPAPTTAAPTPAPYNGSIEFAFAMGDQMVLQQAPASAAVYGPIGTSGDVSIEVEVASSTGESYTVPAQTGQTALKGMWKALLKPTKAGGSFKITARCKSGCSGSATISDVTFGDVWYCAGQSNMALPVFHTFHRNISRDAIIAGKYDNIRIHGIKGNMNPDQNWTTLKGALAQSSNTDIDWFGGFVPTNDPESSFFQFSSTCYYFGESLTEELGDDAPPIGLIHTSYGGSMIEEWLPENIVQKCGGENPGISHFLWETAVLPYLDTTVKGFLWYQGENNCHGVMGNSQQKTGYGCLLPEMLSYWRKSWSSTASTTDPMAPMGVVTLASGGSEGGNDIGGMRFSQTANYGLLPNDAMPNSFLAHAYDLGDPWTDYTCLESWKCCYGNYNETTCMAGTKGNMSMCTMACRGLMNTSIYMGGIHPRVKKEVGIRLARAAVNAVYGGKTALSGPTISGCTATSSAITINFNASLLMGGSIALKNTYSQFEMYVLVDPGYWCHNTTLNEPIDGSPYKWFCNDNGAPDYGNCGKSMMCGGDLSGVGSKSELDDMPQPWIQVNMSVTSSTSITLDLSPLQGVTPVALRYAWGQDYGDSCCPSNTDVSKLVPCIPGSCPLYDSKSGLPANPFVAKIENGKCKCVVPQTCDE